MRFCIFLLAMVWWQLQAQTDSVQYFDRADRIVRKENAAYYRKISTPDSGKTYLGVEYWIDGHIKMAGQSLDPYFFYKTGKFTYYYTNGNKSGEGYYYSDFNDRVFGFKNKKWETWYPNGLPREEWWYKIADDFAYSEALLITFWDTAGAKLTNKGNGSYYYTEPVNTKEGEQKVTFTGPIREGRYDSIWHGYYANGKVYCKEAYRQGKLIKGTSFDATGKPYTYDSLETPVRFPGGKPELDRFVKLNMQYTLQKDDIPGQSVILHVFIGHTGFAGNASIIQSANHNMDMEAMRIAKLLPRFKPATFRGQPVDAFYTMTIPFDRL